MGYLQHKHESPVSVDCAVLTISDSRTEQDDESGDIIKRKLSENGHRVVSYGLLKNDADTIRKMIYQLVSGEVQVIIASGGTGIGRKDVTVETVSSMLEKRLDGFGELFRSLTYQEIGTGSIMSRAVAGVVGGKVIFCLPGSPNVAGLAMDRIILPEIGHVVREATK